MSPYRTKEPQPPRRTWGELFEEEKATREDIERVLARAQSELTGEPHGTPRYYINSGIQLALEELKGYRIDRFRKRYDAWLKTLSEEERCMVRDATRARAAARRAEGN